MLVLSRLRSVAAPRPRTRDELARRVLQHMKRSPIASLPAGPAATVGRVRGGRQLFAPWTARPCVAFRLDVHVNTDNGWRLVVREQRANDFELHDGTGVVLVHSSGADLLPAGARRWSYAEPGDLPPTVAEVLRARGAWPGQVPMLVEEWLIRDGDTTAVFGVVERRVDASAAAAVGYRTAAPTRSILRRDETHPLVISNEGRTLRASGLDVVPSRPSRR